MPPYLRFADIIFGNTLFSDANPHYVQWLRSHGNGSFAGPYDVVQVVAAGGTIGVGVRYVEFDVADIDGDGDLDVAVSVSSNAHRATRWVAADASAPADTRFTEAGTTDLSTGTGPDTPSAPVAVRVADINNDGAPDVLVAGRESKAIVAFQAQPGTSPRTFAPDVHVVYSDPQQILHMEIADVDDDGDLDVVASTLLLVLWVQNLMLEHSLQASPLGDLFVDPADPSVRHAITLFTQLSVHSFSVLDISGDGLPDLVVTDSTAGRTGALLHTGATCAAAPAAPCTTATDMFEGFVSFTGELQSLQGSAVVDADNDADPDVFTMQGTGEVTLVRLNYLCALVVDPAAGDDTTCLTDVAAPCKTVAGALLARSRSSGATVVVSMSGSPVLGSPLSLGPASLKRPVVFAGDGAATTGLSCNNLASGACIVLQGAPVDEDCDTGGLQSFTVRDMSIGFVQAGVVSANGLSVTMRRVHVVNAVNALGGGAAVAATSSAVHVAGCTFTSNIANGNGGAVAAVDSSLLVEDSTFAGCQGVGGGAIAAEATTPFNVQSSTVTIVDGTFTSCTAQDLADGNPLGGGAVRVSGSLLQVQGRTSFASCSAVKGSGGALSATENSVVRIQGAGADEADRVTATTCAAVGAGVSNTDGAVGGFLAADRGSLVEVTNLLADGCSAAAGGGAVSVDTSASVQLDTVTLRGCSANQGGGAQLLSDFDGTVALRGFVADTCTATAGSGGGVFWRPSGPRPSLTTGAATEFRDCAAPVGGGGGLFADETPGTPVAYTVAAATFTGNAALYSADVGGPAFSVAFGESPLAPPGGGAAWNVIVHTGVDLPAPHGLASLQLLDRSGNVVLADNATSCRLAVRPIAAPSTATSNLAFPSVYAASQGVVSLVPFRVNREPYGSALALELKCGTVPPFSGVAIVDSVSVVVNRQLPPVALPSNGSLQLPVAPSPVLGAVGGTFGDVLALDDLVCDVVPTAPTELLLDSPTEFEGDVASGTVRLTELLVDAPLGATAELDVQCRRTSQGQTPAGLDLPSVALTMPTYDLQVAFTSAPPAVTTSGVVFTLSAEVRDGGPTGAVVADDDYTRCVVVVVDPAPPAAAGGAPVGGSAIAVDGLLTWPAVTFSGVVDTTYTLSLSCRLGNKPVPVVASAAQPAAFAVAIAPCDIGSAPGGPGNTQCVECRAGEASANGTSCDECPAGTYSTSPGSTTCTNCPLHTYSETPGLVAEDQCLACSTVLDNGVTTSDGADASGLCVCQSGFYELQTDASDPTIRRACSACVAGMDCSTPGSTVETLRVLPSFWRQLASSSNVRECRLDGVCVGGIVGVDPDDEARRRALQAAAPPADTQCLDFHTGPLCELCEEGYGLNDDDQCELCASTSYLRVRTAGWIMLAIVLTLLAVVCTFKCRRARRRARRDANMTQEEIDARAKEEKERLDAVSALTSRWVVKFKLAIAFLQVSTVMTTSYDIDFPNVVDKVSSYFEFVNFSLFSFVQIGCKATAFDQFDRLLVVTLIPLVLVAVLAAAHTAFRCLPVRPWTKAKWQLGTFAAILSVTFLCYPIVAREVVQTFRCTSFDDGSKYLEADFRINCKSDRYDDMFAYSIFCIVIFIVGIPVFYFVTLFRVRHVLYQRNRDRIITVTHGPKGSTLWVDSERFTSLDHTMLRDRVNIVAYQITVKRADARSRFQALLPRLRAAVMDQPLEPGTPTPTSAAGQRSPSASPGAGAAKQEPEPPVAGAAGAGADAGAGAGAGAAVDGAGGDPADVETGSAKPVPAGTIVSADGAKAREAAATATLRNFFSGGSGGSSPAFADVVKRAKRDRLSKKRAMVTEVISRPGANVMDRQYHYVFPTRNDEERALVDDLAWQWHRLRYDVKADVEARDEVKDVFHLKLLYEDYEPKFWYW